MAAALLADALARSTSRSLSVLDLIRVAESVGKTDREQARTLYANWIEHNADNPLLYSILFNYSVVLSDVGDLAGARDSLERAIALNPDFLPAHINLGRLRERVGGTAEALQQWSAVLDKLAGVNASTLSHKTTTLVQAARVLEAAGQDDRAEHLLRQCIEIDPSQREAVQHFLALRQRQCEWPVVTPVERVDRATLMAGLSPLSAGAYADDPMLQLAVAWHYNKHDVGEPASPVIAQHWAAQRPGPLRIGYLSSDLREHAVGHLMAETFALHDRGQVEVFAYYCGVPAQDALSEAFKATADHWLDISGMDDRTAARRIADDGVQILVDVNGYTREGRTKLLALRPAPVIVNWLGFPGSLASPYHHYIVADDWIIPPQDERYYSEKVLRLPCYQPNNRRRTVSQTAPTRAEAGLPETGTVFCCFNGLHKITRFTFERWLEILKRTPGSVLWLLGGAEGPNGRLRDYAADHGVEAERIVFADKKSNPDHLARYPLADLFLDTTPYGAHTTASDALWMGVPVLTLNGRSFPARVCGSLVRAAGLPELVCESAQEYVDRAVALGRDPKSLARLRETLLEGRDSCVLFDTPLLVREMERLYAGMWSDFQAGALPRPDLANLDVYMEMASRIDYEATDLQTVADYEAWWREMLMQRHGFRPIAPDRRMARDLP